MKSASRSARINGSGRASADTPSARAPSTRRKRRVPITGSGGKSGKPTEPAPFVGPGQRSPHPDKLTAREELFVLHYVALKNGTEAYLQAGYKGSRTVAGSCAAQLLQKPRVAKAVEARKAKGLALAEMSADEAMERIAAIASADPAGMYDDAGKLLPIPQWPEKLRLAVAGDILNPRLVTKLPSLLAIAEAGGRIKRKLDINHGGLDHLAALLGVDTPDEEK